MFWSEKEPGFGEPGGTSPPRIPRSTSTPPPPKYLRSRIVFVSANYKLSLLSFQRSMLGIPGSNGIPGVPGVPGVPGPMDPREEKV